MTVRQLFNSPHRWAFLTPTFCGVATIFVHMVNKITPYLHVLFFSLNKNQYSVIIWVSNNGGSCGQYEKIIARPQKQTGGKSGKQVQHSVPANISQ